MTSDNQEEQYKDIEYILTNIDSRYATQLIYIIHNILKEQMD